MSINLISYIYLWVINWLEETITELDQQDAFSIKSTISMKLSWKRTHFPIKLNLTVKSARTFPARIVVLTFICQKQLPESVLFYFHKNLLKHAEDKAPGQRYKWLWSRWREIHRWLLTPLFNRSNTSISLFPEKCGAVQEGKVFRNRIFRRQRARMGARQEPQRPCEDLQGQNIRWHPRILSKGWRDSAREEGNLPESRTMEEATG